MKTAYRSSFARDLSKISDRAVLQKVQQAIQEVEGAADLHAVANVRKMSGGGNFYRIRIGDYRIGLAVEGDQVEFVRCLHRRDIYRFFP